MALTQAQRDALERLGDFTDDSFLQPQYASMVAQALTSTDAPIHADDAIQWAREREWPELRVGLLGGIAWAAEHLPRQPAS